MTRAAAAALLAAALLMPVAARAAGPARIRCGVEMRNVSLRIADDIVLQVHALDGEFVSRLRARPPIFDDPNSYTLRLKSAEIAMDGASLTNMLRDAMTAHPTQLRDVKIAIEGDHLHTSGKIQKGAPVPFTMEAAVSVTADGWMRLHATKLNAVGVPVKGILDLFGLKMDDLMKLPAGAGMKVDGDDLLIDAASLMPPPKTEGRLQSVSIAGSHLTMHMVGAGEPTGRPTTLPLPGAKNYIYFYGGTIRFGKLTMTNADMQLIDADPRDPFDFSPPHYEKQLIAGYSRNTARKGLQVYMPDYGDIMRRGAAPLPPPRIK
jgi:hypothetical protein